MPPFMCPYAVHNPLKYNASNRYKSCMDPGFPNISRLKTHIKSRHYDEEHIQPDVRYQLEQQRRRQNDEKKWKSIYEILFPGEIAPSSFFINPISADSNDVSPRTQSLPTAPEVSTPSNSAPAEPNGHQGNIAMEPMQGVLRTSSTSDVSPIVTNDSSQDNPGFFDDAIWSAESEVSDEILKSWGSRQESSS
ncbi:hypothetical protein V8E54_010379 [Elaphomyces granulatus]